MSIRRITLTAALGGVGALLVASIGGTACVVVAGDNGDAGTTTGTGTGTGTGSTTDAGTGSGDDVGTGTGTGTVTGTSTGDDGGVPFDWTKSDAVYARFVLATSDFATGTNFDICYAPWPDETDKTKFPDDLAYVGPIANQVGGSGASFTAPEVTNYFMLDRSKIDGSAAKSMVVRLVVPAGTGPDTANPCGKSNRFQLGGAVVRITDDVVDNLAKGFNTVVIYGNLATSGVTQLTDVFGEDPTAAPSLPTLEFFNGFNTGGIGVPVGVSFTGTDAVKYTFTGGTGLSYGKYTALPLIFSGTFGAAIAIQSADFDLGASGTVSVGLSGFSLSNDYFWGFAYGASASEFSFYLCKDSVAIASSTNYKVDACSVYHR